MRKCFLWVGAVLLGVSKSQEIEKFWRFGFFGTGHLDWIKSEEKIIENAGMRLGYGYGFYIERILSGNGRYSIISGLHVYQFGGKLKYKDIVSPSAGTFYEATTTVTYSLRYVTLPVVMKMRTNEIGNARYYIGFGFGLGFRWKALADKEAIYYVGTEEKTLSDPDLNYAKYTTFFRINMNIEGGMEYNMTGSTWLIVNIYFNNGLTNIFSSEAKAPPREGEAIKGFPNPPEEEYVKFKGITNFVGLGVGFLF